ncbi:MAG: porin [Sulfuritalea sp.]|nr:porin [Sulfuritalea sp.]
MQKKIIALAIAGLSSAAFAQSTVTLSGLVDGGYYSQSLETAGMADTKTAFASNGSSTSALFITVTEDLGGGNKVKFFGESDWQFGTNTATGLLNSYNYLEVSGNWGALKGGNLNTDALYATIAAQPFGTGIGSGISGAFGRLSRAGSNGVYAGGTAGLVAAEGEAAGGISGARSVRINNSLQYSTPSMGGFSASLQWAKKNDEGLPVAAASNTAGFTAIGLKYNKGPINVHYVNEQISNGGQLGSGNALTLAAGEKVTHNILAGNYTFGPATVYAGWTRSKNSGNAVLVADSRSWNLGLKYAVSGALSLAGQILRVDDKSVTDADRNLNAVGIDYAMSKRTTAYGRYETGDNNKNGATGNGVGGFNRWQAGLRHSF